METATQTIDHIRELCASLDLDADALRKNLPALKARGDEFGKNHDASDESGHCVRSRTMAVLNRIFSAIVSIYMLPKGVATDSMLDEYARRRLSRKMLVSSTVKRDASILPHLVRQILEISDTMQRHTLRARACK